MTQLLTQAQGPAMHDTAIRVGRRALLASLGLALPGCSYGPDPERRLDYVLTYHDASTALDPAASAVIDRAAAAAIAAPDLGLTVAGYADSPRAPEASQITSRIRAQIVADTLVQKGIARSRIQLVPRRAIGADPGIESQRVEIRLGS